MQLHWGWSVLTLMLTGLLLIAFWVLAIWATVGTGIELIDLVYWGLSLALLVSVAVNTAWPPTLALNGAMIWFLVATDYDGWLEGLGRGFVLLLALNVLLLAIFYARRRSIA